MKISKKIQSVPVLLLALSMLFSCITFAAGEGEAAESAIDSLPLIYSQDFGHEAASTAGWICSGDGFSILNGADDFLDKWGHKKGFAIPENASAFYDADLGDRFKIVTYGYHGYNAMYYRLNTNGNATSAEGVQIRLGKDNDYGADVISLTVNGEKPSGWKDIVYVTATNQAKEGFSTRYPESNFEIKAMTTDILEYRAHEDTITYDRGVLTFKATVLNDAGDGYADVREFTYDLTQDGTVAVLKNGGIMGIKGESEVKLSGIDIYSANVGMKTLFEQDFTTSGLTTDQLSAKGFQTANVDLTTDGMVLDSGTDVFLFDKNLGTNWKVQAKVKAVGARNDIYNTNYYWYINSNASISDSGFSVDQGYRIQLGKNLYP